MLQIQGELVNNTPLINISQTAAGKVLSSHMDETCRQREAEINRLRETMQSGGGNQIAALTAAVEEQQAGLAQLRADQLAMNANLLQAHAEEQGRFAATIDGLEARWREDIAREIRKHALRERDLAEASSPIARLRAREAEQASRRQLEAMNADFERRMAAAQMARGAWVGPVLGEAVRGVFTLAAAGVISSGE
jgi:hypothetical protein